MAGLDFWSKVTTRYNNLLNEFNDLTIRGAKLLFIATCLECLFQSWYTFCLILVLLDSNYTLQTDRQYTTIFVFACIFWTLNFLCDGVAGCLFNCCAELKRDTVSKKRHVCKIFVMFFLHFFNFHMIGAILCGLLDDLGRDQGEISLIAAYIKRCG